MERNCECTKWETLLCSRWSEHSFEDRSRNQATHQMASNYSVWCEGATVGGDGMIYGASRNGDWILVIHEATERTCDIEFTLC